MAARFVAGLLVELGREAESEQLSRQGFSPSLVRGAVLEERGRASEAEEAYRAAIAEGQTTALIDLAALLGSQPGREREAEQLYRAAVAAGYTSALGELALLVAQQTGREKEAEQMVREAIKHGDVLALPALGSILSRLAGGGAEADVTLQQTAARMRGRGRPEWLLAVEAFVAELAAREGFEQSGPRENMPDAATREPEHEIQGEPPAVDDAISGTVTPIGHAPAEPADQATLTEANRPYFDALAATVGKPAAESALQQYIRSLIEDPPHEAPGPVLGRVTPVRRGHISSETRSG